MTWIGLSDSLDVGLTALTRHSLFVVDGLLTLQSGLHGQSKPYMWAQPRLVSVPGSSLSYAKANAELTAMSKRELGK